MSPSSGTAAQSTYRIAEVDIYSRHPYAIAYVVPDEVSKVKAANKVYMIGEYSALELK
ncbi:MAG: hypothetical protein ABI041_15585 [Bdellovibrionia bacterium]